MNNKLKFYRNQLNLTARDVADYLNMSKSAYSVLENGVSKLDMERAIKLTELYKKSLEDLIILTPTCSSLDLEKNILDPNSIERITVDIDYIKASLAKIKNKLNL